MLLVDDSSVLACDPMSLCPLGLAHSMDYSHCRMGLPWSVDEACRYILAFARKAMACRSTGGGRTGAKGAN